MKNSRVLLAMIPLALTLSACGGSDKAQSPASPSSAPASSSSSTPAASTTPSASQTPSSSPSTETTSAAPAAAGTTVTAKDGSFTVTLPKGFKASADKDPDTMVMAMNGANMITFGKLPLKSLDKAKQEIMQKSCNSAAVPKGAKVLASGATTIAGDEAFGCSIQMKTSGVEVTAVAYTWVHNNQAYGYISAFTASTDKAASTNKAVLDSISWKK